MNGPVKAASEIYMPVGGSVKEVNTELESAPETVNESPEDTGWLVRIEPDSQEGLTELMDPDQYTQYLKSLE